MNNEDKMSIDSNEINDKVDIVSEDRMNIDSTLENKGKKPLTSEDIRNDVKNSPPPGTVAPWMLTIDHFRKPGWAVQELKERKEGSFDMNTPKPPIDKGESGVSETRLIGKINYPDLSSVPKIQNKSKISNIPEITIQSAEIEDINKYMIGYFDYRNFKNPRLEINIKSYKIDIAKYPVSGFFPGYFRDQQYRGSMFIMMPVVALDPSFMSTDQLNAALNWYAWAKIRDKDYFVKNFPEYAKNYDQLRSHFETTCSSVHYRNEINKRYWNVATHQSVYQKAADFRQLDEDWVNLRKKYAKILFNNFKPYHDKNNPWFYIPEGDRAWDNLVYKTYKENQHIPIVVPVWRQNPYQFHNYPSSSK